MRAINVGEEALVFCGIQQIFVHIVVERDAGALFHHDVFSLVEDNSEFKEGDTVYLSWDPPHSVPIHSSGEGEEEHEA